tara:strand:+ start:596 stop:787 length:192 start_codon:yes stop_codon:yes gene_type:complete
MSFIKEQVRNDLASQRSTLGDLDEDSLRKICVIVENSIQSNFLKSSGEITAVAREVQSKINES